MKKIIAILMVLVMCFMFAACDAAEDTGKSKDRDTSNRKNSTDELVNSDGLVFKLLKDGSAYMVDDAKNCTKEIVEVPSEFKGLPVTTIGSLAFHECNKIKRIVLPDTITLFENSAFNGCKSLEEINIPASVTALPEMTFDFCFSLKSITIPDTVCELGISAFRHCSSLKEIVIPASIKTIRRSTFEGCSSLENVTVLGSLDSIGDLAFSECHESLTVTVYGTVKEKVRLGQSGVFGDFVSSDGKLILK